MAGKGSKRRPCQISRVEEDLRYSLAFGTITEREFKIGMKAAGLGNVTNVDEEKYDDAGHVKCKHRLINAGPSRDFCDRKNDYCDYRRCEQYRGHENDD